MQHHAGEVRGRTRLDGHHVACGRDPAGYPHLIATMWLDVTETGKEAERMVRDVFSSLVNRDPAELTAQVAIRAARALHRSAAGVRRCRAQQILLWPVRDPIDQLHRFDALVRPHLRA